MRMRALGIVLIGVLGCSEPEPDACPSTELAGGTFPVFQGPGAYVVEIAQGDVHLTTGFAVGAPEPALPHEAWAFVEPDRWLRLTTADAKTVVQECRRGGTQDRGCDEIGPPNSGRLVGYRDGVEVIDIVLFAPSLPLQPVVEGCPLLFGGHVELP